MASASAIRAGDAFYEMSLKDDVTVSLARIQGRFATFGRVLTSLNPTTGGPLTFAKAVTDSFRAAVASAADLGRMLRLVGGGLVAGGVAVGGPLAMLFKGGFDRGAELVKLSRQLGLPVEMLNKFQYAAERAGVSIDEVMQDWTGRYSDLIKQAPPIDARDAYAAAQAQKDLADATRALQDALLPLASSIAPYIKMGAEWVKQNAHLIAPIAILAAGVTALGAALAGTGLVIGAVAAAVPGLFIAAKAAVIIGGSLAHLAGLAYLAHLFVTQTETGRQFADMIRGDLAPALETGRKAYLGMADALKKGDLSLALDIGAAGLETMWAELTLSLEKRWLEFTGFFEDAWVDATAGMEPILQEFWTDFKTGWNYAKGIVTDAADWIGRKWGDLTDWLARKWDQVWTEIRGPVLLLADLLKPFAAVIAAPFVIAADLIGEIWGGLSANLATNIYRFAFVAESAFIVLGTKIGNFFKDIARTVIDTVIAAAKKLAALDPSDTLKKGIATAEALKDAIGENVSDEKMKAQIAVAYSQKKDALEGIDKERADRTKANKEIRDEKLKGAQENAADKQKGLLELLAEAAKPRGPAEPENLTALKPGLLGVQEVKGAFSSEGLGQQLGYGNQVLKQTEVLLAIRDLLASQPEAIHRALAPLVANQRIW